MAFDLAEIMDEVATVLSGITGLRMTPYPVATLTPPAGVVTFPAPPGIQYQQTYGQGETSMPDLTAHLIASRVTERVARDQAAAWTANSGAQSVPSLLEAHTWTSCDAVTVTSAEFAIATIGTVDYLEIIFHLDVTGPGA